VTRQDDIPIAPGSPATEAAVAPPSLARRFGALIVDWLLCVLVAKFFGGDPRRDAWSPVLVLIIEYGFFIGLFAQTPGMFLTKLRCVSHLDGGRIGVPRAVLRAVLLCLVVPALIMDNRQRGLHDRAAGSVVVPASAINQSSRRAGGTGAPQPPS
jgi:uncharacterized RDD family membrane protein YckC